MWNQPAQRNSFMAPAPVAEFIRTARQPFERENQHGGKPDQFTQTLEKKLSHPVTSSDMNFHVGVNEVPAYLGMVVQNSAPTLEHFSYCCRALKKSRNHAFASSAVSEGSS